MDSVEGKMIKEVLNADTNALAEIIKANPNRVNFVSQCGESPLGIAIYKRDIAMMNVLLAAGAHPNHLNRDGDASFHIAARIGEINILNILYDTGLCNLLTRNKFGKLAYDIGLEKAGYDDVSLLHLFGEWGEVEMDEELRVLKEGRIQCCIFIDQKSHADTVKQRQDDIDTVINSNAFDNRMRRILLDEQRMNSHHYQIPITLPKAPTPYVTQEGALATADSSSSTQMDANDVVSINNNFNNNCDNNTDSHYTRVWQPHQLDRLHNSYSDVIMVSRGIYIKDYINKTITDQINKMV